MPKMQETSTLLDKLIAPLKPLILRSNKTRNCPVLEDEKWITTGLLRVLSSESSSRGFLQQLSDQFQMIIPGSSFFKGIIYVSNHYPLAFLGGVLRITLAICSGVAGILSGIGLGGRPRFFIFLLTWLLF